MLVKGHKKLRVVKNPSHPPDIVPPSKLTGKAVSVRQIASGAYQNKLLAFFAPFCLPKAFNALMRAVDAGDIQAIKTLFDRYMPVHSGKGGVSIFQQIGMKQQQNNNNTHPRPSDESEISDFEDIVRILDEERKTIDVRNQQIEATPEGPAE